MIKFAVENEPIPQARPRFGRGKIFEPARVSKYKEEVKAAATAAMKGAIPISSAVNAKIKAFRKFKATSRRFGDADNLAKAVLDACNGIIFCDDAQITKLTVEKIQSAVPRLEVEFSQEEIKKE